MYLAMLRFGALTFSVPIKKETPKQPIAIVI